MKQQGAEIVAKDAVDLLIDYLEKISFRITDRAMEFSRHSNRKKITKGDINLVLRRGCYYPGCD